MRLHAAVGFLTAYSSGVGDGDISLHPAPDVRGAAHGDEGSRPQSGALRALKAKLYRATRVALTTPRLYPLSPWQRRFTARLLNYAPTEALRGLSLVGGPTVAEP